MLILFGLLVHAAETWTAVIGADGQIQSSNGWDVRPRPAEKPLFLYTPTGAPDPALKQIRRVLPYDSVEKAEPVACGPSTIMRGSEKGSKRVGREKRGKKAP